MHPHERSLIINHELHELAEKGRGNRGLIFTEGDAEYGPLMQKIVKINNSKPIQAIGRAFYLSPKKDFEAAKRIMENKKFWGSHHNLAVLGKESNDLRRLQLLHGSDIGMGGLVNNVRNHGERQLIKRITGKRYGIDPISKDDLNKLRKAPHDIDVKFGRGHIQAYNAE